MRIRPDLSPQPGAQGTQAGARDDAHRILIAAVMDAYWVVFPSGIIDVSAVLVEEEGLSSCGFDHSASGVKLDDRIVSSRANVKYLPAVLAAAFLRAASA